MRTREVCPRPRLQALSALTSTRHHTCQNRTHEPVLTARKALQRQSHTVLSAGLHLEHPAWRYQSSARHPIQYQRLHQKQELLVNLRIMEASMPPASPKKAWAMNTEATPIVVPSPVPHPPTPPRIYSPTAVGQAKAYTPSSSVPVSDTQIKSAIPIALSPTTQKAVEKKPRIQSAPPQRPAVTPKLTRAIRSAGKSTVTLWVCPNWNFCSSNFNLKLIYIHVCQNTCIW